MPQASGSDLMGATEAMLARLSPDMRDLLRELLLHKSLFVGEAFVGLAAKDDAHEGRTFRGIFDETVAQGVDASRSLEEWDRLRLDPDAVERLAGDVRRNLIEALIVLKKISTEAFLATAMAAPTSSLRDELMRLADVDRMHADRLRTVIGASTIPERLRKEQADRAQGPCGAHAGRYLEGPLSRSVEATLHKLRTGNGEPVRLVLSPESVRHLRDEGCVHDHTAFGLPIDLDLAWTGEAFAVITRDRASLAEVLTATSAGQ